MLEDEARWIEPVVKNLTAHDMAADTPAIFVALLAQPVVTKRLCVEVMRFVRRMMHMILGAFEEEEAMVINKFCTPVKM